MLFSHKTNIKKSTGGGIFILTGKILKERYCILEEIGKGGQGHVYLCRDLELGSLWAVKEISVFQKKEAWILRTLEHPFLPKLVDYVEQKETCYLVMEYIRGKNLQEWLKSGKKFSYKEVLEIGIAAAQVLDYLHNQSPSLYYGDLKPENLMRTEEGSLYLIDFGSVSEGHRTWQRRCMGTREYAAPEQREGIVNVRTDVYAFGKTMLKLCRKETFYWKYPCMMAVFRKCCRENPIQRYASMNIVEQKLKRFRRLYENRNIGRLICAAVVVLLLAAGRTNWKKASDMPAESSFSEAFALVTERYLQPEFLEGSLETRQAVCEKAEKELQKLQRNYPKQQKEILLLLAANAELQGKIKETAAYYEQLLAAAPQCREVYGEYGLFLLRNQNPEESRKLWERYWERESSQELEGGYTHNLFVWEERIAELEE